MTILDGKTVANKIREQVADRVARIRQEEGVRLSLAVVLVGDDPASLVYVRNKEIAAEEAGILSRTVRMAANATTQEVRQAIEALNRDDTVHGIILQLPLPPQCDATQLQEAIMPQKDVDGLTALSKGCLSKGMPCLTPCTPKGVLRLLQAYSISPAGKHAVVVGRSNLVGKPLASLLLAENATVTVCHSQTQNLAAICQTADILCTSVGKPHLIGAEYVKEGAVVVDVGICRQDGKLLGDVDFDEVAPRCLYITPVPGGIGPMTVAMLLENTLEAYRMAKRS